MTQGQLPPPDGQRPWYYRNWFLLPAFVFGWPVWLQLDFILLWPVWPILIIRSPWHNGFITGSLSWAMLMSSGYLIALQFIRPGSDPLSTVMQVAPGLVLAFIIQSMWSKYRREQQASGPDQAAANGDFAESGRSRESGLKRRRRRRASRSDRSSRRP